MKYAIIITILAFAFATTLYYGEALKCYTCEYGGTGDDSANCKTPNSETLTADNISGVKCKVCGKVATESTAGTAISRACVAASTETNKCKTEDKTTACVCDDTDLCNGAMNGRPMFSAAATLAFTAAVALLYKNFL